MVDPFHAVDLSVHPCLAPSAMRAVHCDAGMPRAEEKTALAPESPPQMSEGPSAAQLHHAAEAMANGNGFTESDMLALKAMMSDLKGAPRHERARFVRLSRCFPRLHSRDPPLEMHAWLVHERTAVNHRKPAAHLPAASLADIA